MLLLLTTPTIIMCNHDINKRDILFTSDVNPTPTLLPDKLKEFIEMRFKSLIYHRPLNDAIVEDQIINEIINNPPHDDQSWVVWYDPFFFSLIFKT